MINLRKKVKNNYVTKQKLMKSINQISKVIAKSEDLDQDSGDVLQPSHFHSVKIHQSSVQFDYILL